MHLHSLTDVNWLRQSKRPHCFFKCEEDKVNDMIGKVKLRKEYKEHTGKDWKMLNSTAQPTIEYVKWLESKLIAMHNDVGSYYKAEIEAAYDKGLEDGYACMPSNL